MIHEDLNSETKNIIEYKKKTKKRKLYLRYFHGTVFYSMHISI